MARQLFGTDGIRGVAGKFPMDARTAQAFGTALGRWARHHSSLPKVVIGMDTRESGPWLASAVAAGLKSEGVGVRFAGVITTPGVAYLTRTQQFVAGVMISASHNPFEDNGLKAFDHSGFKLPDGEELELERGIFGLLEPGSKIGSEELNADLIADESLDNLYTEYLISTSATRFQGKKLVLDCANGAAYQLGPALFRKLGAEVLTTNCNPDGRNINLNCGALHVDSLRAEVLRTGADLGMAFDGDADRCILISHSGKIIDGDAVLLIVGAALQSAGRLTSHSGKPTVVATVMSNLGLEQAFRRRGIEMLRTPVGDKYVLEEMVSRGAVVGGEQSGHIIFREFATTGDGLLTALTVLQILQQSGATADELTADLEVFPQRLVNVRVKERRPLDQLPGVQQEIDSAEQEFAGSGRVLVRFSGTEPLARVMVEGAELAQVDRIAHKIAGAIRAELG